MDFRSFFSHKSYWGKLFGAFFGFLIGGPAGALFGIIIGNFFDRGLVEHFNRPYTTFQDESNPHVQTLFIQTTFMIMGYIAKAEGRVSEDAIDVAKTFMQDLQLNKTQIEMAKNAFNTGKKSDFKLVETLLPFKHTLQAHPHLIMTFLNIQYRAIQNQGFTYKKLRALNQVLQVLGFAPIQEQARYYDNSDRSYTSAYSTTSSLAEAYSILNLEQHASKTTVKHAYRKLISQHHPDKLIAKGKSEAEIKRANEKTQKIRKAYETICAAKGWD